MNRKQILDILFWIFLIISIVLIAWKVFGNSPTDLSIIIFLFSTLIFKLWTLSDETKEFKHEFKVFKHEIKNSFSKVRKDFDELNNKLKKK